MIQVPHISRAIALGHRQINKSLAEVNYLQSLSPLNAFKKQKNTRKNLSRLLEDQHLWIQSKRYIKLVHKERPEHCQMVNN